MIPYPNNTTMIILFISIYLVISFLLTAIGIEKQSEGFKIFLISILLTPIVGLIFMLKEKRSSSKITYTYCPECDYIFPVKMSHCPICAEQHKKIRLTKYVSPYKSTKLIRNLKLT
jgi:hypothetical protein